MSNKIIADTFETLGKVAQSASQQAVSGAQKMTEEAAIELGLKPQTQGTTDDAQKQDQAKQEEIDKMKAVENQKTVAGYKKVQEEIRRIGIKREQEIPKEVSGKPGFDEGKMVKQIETGPSFAKATEGKQEEKKKLPPINVQREKTKAERFRGISG